MDNAMDELALRKIDAEIAKLIAETVKINGEARWYPWVATAGIFGAALVVAKWFLV